LRIPDIYENRDNQFAFARFGEGLKAIEAVAKQLV